MQVLEWVEKLIVPALVEKYLCERILDRESAHE